MSRGQRLGFLGLAVAIAIFAAILLGSSAGEERQPAGTNAEATPTETGATATATPEPTATARPEPPLVSSDGVAKLRFDEGDTVRFRVRSDVADEVHVHGYDLSKDVEPGREVSFSFRADITGIFEIELEGAGQQIAQLRVDPR